MFASWLEQIYITLRERFPGRFDEIQLKDRLFHGMMQGLYDSMRFLHKDPRVNYWSLLEATEEAKDEVGEARVRAKSAAVENDGIKDLKDRIETLTSLMKEPIRMEDQSRINNRSQLHLTSFRRSSGIMDKEAQRNPMDQVQFL